MSRATRLLRLRVRPFSGEVSRVMKLKPLYSRQTLKNSSRCYRSLSGYNRSAVSESHLWSPKKLHSSVLYSRRYAHSAQAYEEEPHGASSESMNEFLSRFVWLMRGKLVEVYTDYDKNTIDAMLLVIVEKVVSRMEKGDAAQVSSDDFSQDLWKTVWEVSNVVSEDMAKAKRKEKLKRFLHADKVKEMCRFAGEVGIRGDMLRELRFKWAREEMEESDFYESLELMRQDPQPSGQDLVEDQGLEEETTPSFSLPKRHGKFKYNIYGLDLSNPKWAQVANRIHQAGEGIYPQDPKPVSGKCYLIMDEIVMLKAEEDVYPLLAEWASLWSLAGMNGLIFSSYWKRKIAEHVLSEESFQSNIRDYSKIIDVYAQENRVADAERILQRMSEKGIAPDILTSNILVYMYSKAGNLDKAKKIFEILRAQGIQPDKKLYSSMIMAYLNSGQPDFAESLMKDMETRDIKPSPEIYMALLQSYSRRGNFKAAQRIIYAMQFAGIQPSRESCTLLIEAYGQAGYSENARSSFDNIIKLGHNPDDRSMASMIAAYQKDNLLDTALNLLLHHKKDGFEPGIATYTVLVDWLGELQLIDEAEQILDKISHLGEAPSLLLQVSLCVMYASVGYEKKALQALGVLEARKEQLGTKDYDRIIRALISGGFIQEAQRIYNLMEAQGLTAPDGLLVQLKASEAQTVARR